MRLRFLKDIAFPTSVLRAGRIVEVDRLPKGWADWITRGLIEVLPAEPPLAATAPRLPEAAVLPRAQRRRRARGSAVVA